MNIDRVIVAQVDRSLVVGLASGERISWGEAVLDWTPVRSAEWLDGAYQLATRVLAPRLVGQWIGEVDTWQEVLNSVVGQPRLKCAFDLAWWQGRAAAKEKTLAEFLGHAEREIESVPRIAAHSDIDATLTELGELFAQGDSTVKLEFTPQGDPRLLQAVRQVFPYENISLACGGRFDPELHADWFYRLDDFMLPGIEQPFAADRIFDCARLAQSIHTPVWLHESITRPDLIRPALEQARFGLTLDLLTLGGLSPAIAALDIADEEGATVALSLAERGVFGLLEEATLALASDPRLSGAVDVPREVFAGNSEAVILDEETLLTDAVRWCEIV
jgi:O-succinylbenzoate synthase